MSDTILSKSLVSFNKTAGLLTVNSLSKKFSIELLVDLSGCGKCHYGY